MIDTLRPYGAINESQIQFLVEHPNKQLFFLVDNYSNQWIISKETFDKLVGSGFQVKGVKIK